MKTYTAHPERIGRNEKTEKLYDLEDKLKYAMEKVIDWREENFDEKRFENAVPQTLLMILDSYDTFSSKVAAKSFLSGKQESIETESMV